jgi:pSer/pThr/pTyr-binding forkhead associated (FHA) protein/uncharacterized OB-fold protein
MAVTCQVCGAQNDPASRFCDQCGAALVPVATTAQPATVTVTTCPQCGSPVLPGEAFCDECGADLSALHLVAADAPTVVASSEGMVPPEALEPEERPLDPEQQPVQPDPIEEVAALPVTSPSEAEANTAQPPLAADATVAQPPLETAPPAEPVPIEADVIEPSDEPPPTPVVAPDTVVAEPAAPSDVVEPDDELPPPAPVLAEPEADAPVVDAVTSAPTDTSAAPAAAAMGTTQAEYDAERQRLEAEIATQRQLVAQFEQMQATFGTATPPAVSQGLAQAQDALLRAEGQLAALMPPAPAIDPAELQRLEAEVATQRQLVTQFEQMQATFGPAAPPAVAQGLGDARAALADAEARLAALGGTPTTTPSAPAPVPASDAAAPTPPADMATATPPSTPPPGEPAAAATPQPRLVVDENGAEIPLDGQRQSFVIGREDPISGIHPEVDLTPHGGESGGVSRQHARLERNGDQWSVIDLDSTNYTRLDGKRLDPNVPTPIADGARLQFGRLALTFRI